MGGGEGDGSIGEKGRNNVYQKNESVQQMWSKDLKEKTE